MRFGSKVLFEGVPVHSPCGDEARGRVVSRPNRLRHVGGDVARVTRSGGGFQYADALRQPMIAEDIVQPAREVVAREVAVDLLGGKRRQSGSVSSLR
jgi:hypothetical protein